MSSILNNFDPISYLSIDPSRLTSEEVSTLRTTLMNKIGEYIMLKLARNLTSAQRDEIVELKDQDTMFQFLDIYIPNLEDRIQQELEQFKTEFASVS